MAAEVTYSISELAREFDISRRTIRFYEEKGLLTPRRTKGNQRRYTGRDCFRLKWIIRGKRFGYSLAEIAKIIGLTEISTDATEQIKMALAYGEMKLKEIEDRIAELKILQYDMLSIKEKLLKRLHDMESTATPKASLSD